MSQLPDTSSSHQTQGQPGSGQVTAADAIDRMFAEFELVFHNQYHKAFASKEKEDWAKKLWYSNLKEFSAEEILSAAHRAIKESDYLPSVHGVLKYCQQQGPILPMLPAGEERPPMSQAEKQQALEKLREETGL